MCERSEHGAVAAEHDHHLAALISVSESEERGTRGDTCDGVARCTHELPLQIATENKLFADARGGGKTDEQHEFSSSLWCDELQPAQPLLQRFIRGDAEQLLESI